MVQKHYLTALSLAAEVTMLNYNQSIKCHLQIPTIWISNNLWWLWLGLYSQHYDMSHKPQL